MARSLAPALLLAAGSGAVLPPLPCDEAGQKAAPWIAAGPATYGGGDARHGRRGSERADGPSDDRDDRDDMRLEDALRTRGDSDRAELRAPALAAASATQAVAEGEPGTWFAGTVNGGVWRTRDIYQDLTKWQNVLDGQPVRCSAISALAVSPFDSGMVVAGCGPSTSGMMGRDWQVYNSGDWGGVMVSRDGGESWAMTPFPPNRYVTSFAFPAPGRVAISTRSTFSNRTDGGVWLADDSLQAFARSLPRQVYNLHYDNATGLLLAAVANDAEGAIWRSRDGGKSWDNWSSGLAWESDQLPFYPCITVNSDGVAFIGALTYKPSDIKTTGSEIFWRRLAGGTEPWTKVGNRPKNLDQDNMPKDRMSVLADPVRPSVLYVNGNAGAVAWRVDWNASKWTSLTEGGAGSPHSDCRNYAWEPSRGNLLLVSDGGVFMRTQPSGGDGGRWSSLNGDITAMEMVDAAWDARLSRWVGGAQDNGVQLAPPNTTGNSRATQIIGGDGGLVQVDNRHDPSRVYGCAQFLSSLGFYQGHGDDAVAVTFPLSQHFPHTGPLAQTFPFFVHPYALNSQDPSSVVIWANGTGGRKDGWYSIDVPQDAKSADDIGAPKLVAKSGGHDVFHFVAGGRTGGKPDPDLLVGVSDKYLLYRSAATAGAVQTRALPFTIAAPVPATIVGASRLRAPESHGKTASVTVSPADSSLIAVTGWPSIDDNGAEEGVALTRDAGETWVDALGDLFEATATVGRIRPSGLLLIDVPSVTSTALLVGTVSGVFVSWVDRPGKWARLGRCSDLPLVMTMGLQYEPVSDTLVAATYGRGVYVIHSAKKALEGVR